MKFQLFPVLAATVIILALAEFKFCDAAVVLEKAGYKLLKVNAEEATGPRGLRAAISYFLSYDLATQAQALQYCREDFGGQLVTPLNTLQINSIRQDLDVAEETSGENFWTAGKQDGCEWYWTTTGRKNTAVLNSANFANRKPVLVTSNRCLSLVGKGANFGFSNDVDSECSNRYRYICEV